MKKSYPDSSWYESRNKYYKKTVVKTKNYLFAIIIIDPIDNK